MGTLPVFVRMDGRACLLLGSGPEADAKRRLLERAGAIVLSDEAAAVGLAVIALDDEDEAAAAAARLRARGVLVNAVDRPALCDWTMPAIVDRTPVLVAIGTDGRSAGLAKALRQRLEAALPADLGRVAETLFALRPALTAAYPDPENRRRAIDAALAPGGPLDPLADRRDGRLEDWADPGAVAQLVVLRLGSADPDDLTLRQARLLGQADRIVHRADVPRAILDRARADAERLCSETIASAPDTGLTIDIGIAP